MGFLSFLTGGGLGAVGEAAKNIEDVFTTSDREKLTAYEAETDRIKVTNELEVAYAHHPSMFVAGARPAIMWVLAFAFAYHFIFFPLVGPFISQATGVELVDLDWQELMAAATTMLGLGAMRSWEKNKGIARKNLKN